jgi:hypothetical protein
MQNTQNFEPNQNREDDLLPENDFDDTEARPNRFATQINQQKITVTLESE